MPPVSEQTLRRIADVLRPIRFFKIDSALLPHIDGMIRQSGPQPPLIHMPDQYTPVQRNLVVLAIHAAWKRPIVPIRSHHYTPRQSQSSSRC